MALIEVNKEFVEPTPEWFDSQTPPDWFAQGGIKSVQRGTVRTSSTSGNYFSISAVDLSKSFLLISTREGYAYGYGDASSFARTVGGWGYLADSVTLRIGRDNVYAAQADNTDYEVTVYWQVVEFY